METALFPCVIESLHEPNYGICACYELDEATSTRKGEVFTFHAGNSDSPLKVIDSVRLDAGVLDCKYVDHTLYAALSTEQLNVYEISRDKYTLSKTDSISKPGEGLFLSVSASPSIDSETNHIVGVSTQQGSVILYSKGEDGFNEHFFASEAHKLAGEAVPAWIVALYPKSTNVFLTGGDDCKFRLWDTRAGEYPTTTKSFHDAGVTTAQWHPLHEYLCVIGSYDESFSIWDTRSLRSPLLHHPTGILTLAFAVQMECLTVAAMQVAGFGEPNGSSKEIHNI